MIPLILIENHDLEQRPAYALGVITKIDNSSHSPGKLYEFYIGDDTIRGRTGLGMTKIRVGDSVIIEYERTNPHNNAVYCYFESWLDRSKLPDTVFYQQPIDNQRRPLKFEE